MSEIMHPEQFSEQSPDGELDDFKVIREGEKIYGKKIRETVFDENEDKQIIDLIEKIKMAFIVAGATDIAEGRKPLRDDIIADTLKGVLFEGQLAALYQRDGKKREAEAILSSLRKTLSEMASIEAERKKEEPLLNQCIAMDETEKIFKLQAILGRFEDFAKSNELLRRMVDSIEEDMSEAIKNRDQREEKRLWSAVLAMDRTPPEKLNKLLIAVNKIWREKD